MNGAEDYLDELLDSVASGKKTEEQTEIGRAHV